MIHVLVVLPGADAREPSAPRLSVEVLVARGEEEAVEKLARNRRVDAVLLMAGADNPAVVRAIREEFLAPPPFFAPPSDDELPGVRRLLGQRLGSLLDEVAAALLARE